MPAITLNELHHFLHRLEGEWAGTETIAPSPWDPSGATAQAVVRNRQALGGSVVLQEYDQSRDGVVVFQGHGVFGVDGNEVVLRWWDSWSPLPREFRGGIVEGALVLTSRDEKTPARATWRIGADAYDYLLEVTQDGASWYRYLEAKYLRR